MLIGAPGLLASAIRRRSPHPPRVLRWVGSITSIVLAGRHHENRDPLARPRSLDAAASDRCPRPWTRGEGPQHPALRDRPLRSRPGPRFGVGRSRTTTPCCPASATRSPTSALRSCGSSSRWTSTRPTPPTASPTPRQAALHPDPLAAQHRDACDDVRSQSRGRAAGDPAGRGAPVVIKLLEGTQGIGVILAPEVNVAEAIIETLHSTKQNVLIQSFVKESRGRDLRGSSSVTGSWLRCAASPMATSSGQRSPRRLGRAVSLPSEYEEAAVRSAQIMGLRVAGVDMLESVDGPLVMEVNSSPASRASKRRPSSTSQGPSSTTSPTRSASRRSTCASASPCRPGTAWPSSPCTGVPISSARRSRSQVSTTATSPSSPSTAGTSVIPNPRRRTELQAEDRLLCFGKPRRCGR